MAKQSKGKRRPYRQGSRVSRFKWYKELSTEIIVAIVLALFPLGWSMLGLPPDPIVGIVCWGLCAGLLIHTLFRTKWRTGLQIFISILLVIGFVGMVVWALRRTTQPDVSLKLYGPLKVDVLGMPPIMLTVSVRNDTNVIARDVKYSVYLFNVSAWSLENPAPEENSLASSITHTANWIGRYSETELLPGFHPLAFLESLKPGDELVGIANVSCLDCLRPRSYWLYISCGNSGWIAEAPEGVTLSPGLIIRTLPIIRENPQQFLNGVPMQQRQTIAEPP